MILRNLWRGLFVALFILVTWLTLTPNTDDTRDSLAIARFIAELLFRNPSLSDKVAHFLAYASLGGSAAFAHFRLFDRRAPMIVALALYGAFLEFLQGLGGVRDAELADALANSMGALAAFPTAIAIETWAVRLRPQ